MPTFKRMPKNATKAAMEMPKTEDGRFEQVAKESEHVAQIEDKARDVGASILDEAHAKQLASEQAKAHRNSRQLEASSTKNAFTLQKRTPSFQEGPIPALLRQFCPCLSLLLVVVAVAVVRW